MSHPAYGGGNSFASVQSLIAAGGDTTVATPATDERIVLDRLIITATSAQNFIVKHGVTNLIAPNCAASDTIDLVDLYLACPAGVAMVLTNPGAGAPSTVVYWHREKRQK